MNSNNVEVFNKVEILGMLKCHLLKRVGDDVKGTFRTAAGEGMEKRGSIIASSKKGEGNYAW